MKMKRFILPRCIKHRDTKNMINSLIKGLQEKGNGISPMDFPSFHRMATAYDLYLTCTETIAREGATMKNLKGEIVKRPEVNIQKENWAQFLEIAKEYGLTAKSGRILKLGVNDEEESPFDKFVREVEKR